MGTPVSNIANNDQLLPDTADGSVQALSALRNKTVGEKRLVGIDNTENDSIPFQPCALWTVQTSTS